MFKLIKNIGCLTIIIFAGIFFYNFFASFESHPSSTGSSSARSDPNARPDELTIDTMFRRADRDYLRSVFGPKANIDRAGSTRFANHRDGWLFVHNFSGRDELGHPVESSSGFLYKTNPAPSWIYYDRDALPTIMKEVGLLP